MNPYIHIILPIYNGEAYILDQLFSIYQQSYKNWHLYVINDASSDNSVEIINNFIKYFGLSKKISLFHNKKNLDVNKSIEKGLKIVQQHCKVSDFVCYCDADDIWTKNKLEVQIQFMMDHPNCDLSYHDMRHINDNNQIIYPSQLKFIQSPFCNLSNNKFGEFATSCHITSTTLMFRAKDINLLIPFSLHLGQDHWTGLVFSSIGKNIIEIPYSLAFYRKHLNSRLTLRTKNKDMIIGFTKRLNALKDLYNIHPNPQIITYQNYFKSRIKWTQKKLKIRWQYILTGLYYPSIFRILCLQVFNYIIHKRK